MISSKTPVKAGIYFSHYECFGHTSRVMAVGEVFKKRFPRGNLFFIQAGVPQPQARLDQWGRLYSLPEAFMDRQSFRKPIRGQGMSAGARGKACLDIIAQENPDLFITEFFPLGREECRHELIPTLIRASAQGAVLLGVAGYPLLTGKDQGWREKILTLYARIIIFAPPVEKEFIAGSFTATADRQRYLDFFQRNSEKIEFAGYLLPQEEVVCSDKGENFLRPSVPQGGACRVAVVRGGGAYYPKVIAEAIRASDLLGEEYYFTVVAGPATTPQEWYLFATLVKKKKINNLVLHRAVGDYEGLMSKSDICVSIASYHSSAILLKHRKKAVVIPFEGYGGQSFHEQPARAALLKEKIKARILSIQDLTAISLVDAIEEMASRPQSVERIPEEWFKGADVLDHTLTELLPRLMGRKADPGPRRCQSRVRP